MDGQTDAHTDTPIVATTVCQAHRMRAWQKSVLSMLWQNNISMGQHFFGRINPLQHSQIQNKKILYVKFNILFSKTKTN